MSTKRLVGPVDRGPEVMITVDGVLVVAYAGESIAAALLANDRRTFRLTRRTGSPRGLFCGIGMCFDCVVSVAALGEVRSCVTPVAPGMVIVTQPVNDRTD